MLTRWSRDVGSRIFPGTAAAADARGALREDTVVVLDLGFKIVSYKGNRPLHGRRPS